MAIVVESIHRGEGLECEDCCSFAQHRVRTPQETFHLCTKHYHDRKDDFKEPQPVGETTSLV